MARDIEWHSSSVVGRLRHGRFQRCSKALRERSQSELKHGDIDAVHRNGDGRAKHPDGLAKTKCVSGARLCGYARLSRAFSRWLVETGINAEPTGWVRVYRVCLNDSTVRSTRFIKFMWTSVASTIHRPEASKRVDAAKFTLRS